MSGFSFGIGVALFSALLSVSGVVWAFAKMLTNRPTHKEVEHQLNRCPKGVELSARLCAIEEDIKEIKADIKLLLHNNGF